MSPYLSALRVQARAAAKKLRDERARATKAADPKPPPINTERRVYELPPELVARILRYQLAEGLPSEAAAARVLLDAGLIKGLRK